MLETQRIWASAVSPFQNIKKCSSFFKNTSAFIAVFLLLVKEVILLIEKQLHERRSGLWIMDKIKIRLPDTEAQKTL